MNKQYDTEKPLSDQDWDALVLKVTRQSPSWEKSYLLIYQWVKQNQISARQMSDLAVIAWQHFGSLHSDQLTSE